MDMNISSSSSDTKSYSSRVPSKATRHHSGTINGEKSSSSRDKQRPQPHPHQAHQQQQQPPGSTGYHFDILSWYPKYQSCQRYFVDHAQHDFLVQAFAAFVNILLPFQRSPAIYTTRGAATAKERLDEISAVKLGNAADVEIPSVSLIPYIRRLVCTGMDVPQIMHGFFGNDWLQGVGPQQETERRNYLFTAKSSGWGHVKRDYDMLPLETVPFLKPLTNAHEEEIVQAEKSWSEWIAMQDWMVGSRAPEGL